jgi:diguanylate cyclase (GGDEF)-like protein
MTMHAHLFVGWELTPALWSAVPAMAFVASYVALDLGHRLPTTRGRQRTRWLCAAALALGTGLWSLHWLALIGQPLPSNIRHAVPWVFGAWAAATAASALSLWWGCARDVGLPRLLGAGLALGVGSVASGGLSLIAMGLAPTLSWDPMIGIVAMAAAAGGACLGYALAAHSRRVLARRLRLPLSAVLLAAGLAAGHAMVTLAVRVPVEALASGLGGAQATVIGLNVGELSLWVAFVTSALLGVLWVGSVAEARMRIALHEVATRLDAAERTDVLTRLPNRKAVTEALEAQAELCDRDGQEMALLFIDLDGLKWVNDSYGRQVGDAVLQAVAGRLRAATPADGLVGRVDGDAFGLLMPAPGGRDDVVRKACEVLEAVAEPCHFEQRQVQVHCSIGMVVYPQQGEAATMMAYAEAAARAVNQAGGSSHAFFQQKMIGGEREQQDLLRDLRLALERREFELYYQPKIHAASGEITGAEALLRWRHPQRGVVSPALFVPVAERFGLIAALGNWVIDEACRQARVWRDQGLRMRVAINLSAHQFRQPDLAERIGAALELRQINPALLTCEITESVAMEETNGTAQIFDKLAKLGVHISVDDFGTGYSSLAYLRKLPAEELKIDRGFVLDLEHSGDARAVVDAVIKLGHALGLKVVAEGVETEAQNQILRRMGCDELQGYLFARPMSAQALTLWAVNDTGPSAIDFRASLFKETAPATDA